MLKYCFLLLLLFNTAAFSQSYKKVMDTHRAHYKQEFVDDPRSPLKKEDLKNLHFFSADSAYRVIANIELLTNEKVVKMPTSSAQPKSF